MGEELWENMKKTCAMLKMSTDDAFSLFAEKMLSEGRPPFGFHEDPFFSPENQSHLRKSIASPESGLGGEHPLADG